MQTLTLNLTWYPKKVTVSLSTESHDTALVSLAQASLQPLGLGVQPASLHTSTPPHKQSLQSQEQLAIENWPEQVYKHPWWFPFLCPGNPKRHSPLPPQGSLGTKLFTSCTMALHPLPCFFTLSLVLPRKHSLSWTPCLDLLQLIYDKHPRYPHPHAHRGDLTCPRHGTWLSA